MIAVGCKPKSRASGTSSRSAATGVAKATEKFKDGDLIFHESTSRQSEMVRVLTRSRWTHMGVVFHEAGAPMVFEAVSPVRRTPIKQWIARGRNGEYVVKRLRDVDDRLKPEVLAKMRTLGKSWLGRPYDLQFRWDDESLYCSELAHKLFAKGAGVKLGAIERAADMNLDDERVRRTMQKRFARGGFDPAEPVVTPDSIFNDDELVEVAR
jgi:hypothetical protein